MKKQFLYIGLPVGLGLVVCVIAVLSGYLYIGLKQPQQVVQTPYRLCDTALIDEYNKVRAASQYSTDNNTLAKYQQDMQRVVDQVTAKPQYAQDPSCAYIVLAHHLYYTQKADEAATAYQQFETAVNRGSGYADYRLKGLVGLDELKGTTESLRYSNHNSATVGD